MTTDRLAASRTRARSLAFIVTSLVLLAAGGCGRDPGATAPDSASTSGATADGTLDMAALPRFESVGSGSQGDPWYLVTMSTVKPLQLKTVAGSRYSLLFLPGSVVGKSIDVTIHERHPDIIDVQFGPHGTQFGVPVTLTINYAGTVLDPAHPNFKPGPIQFYWLDPLPLLWLPIPGVDNPLTKTYTVTLSHFSRYTLARTPPSGTADW
ncbi:MAG TPA: hypothetical protein VF720_14360 [Candidatus Eisenbacteria bacterium]